MGASSPQSPKGAKSPQSPKSQESPNNKAASPSPAPGIIPLTAEQAAAAGILPASHWQQQPFEDDDDADDSASSIDSLTSTTASLSSSIYDYRTVHGRTYHGDIGNAESWTPNDQRFVDAMEIAHHATMVCMGGKLYFTPLDQKKVHKVLDIATGNGMWSIDFADEFPNAEVIGTDISPIQPTWVPPNVKFEIDDCNREWTWPDNTFDFVNLRFLNGIVDDWYALFRNAYRVAKPGSYVESYATGSTMLCDDGIIKPGCALDQWGKVFTEGGKKLGRTFRVYEEDLQRKGMEAAGFIDLQYKDIQVPVGRWHTDKEASERGLWWKLAVEADLEGYINYLWNAVLGWTPEEAKVFAKHMKKDLNNPKQHAYFWTRVMWGRKPE